jgi:GT2 family glycosyltransferase
VDFLPGRNILVARAAFRAVGGFDESLTTNEDKDFTYRLRRGGFPVLRLAETRVVHLGHERGLGEFVRKEFWRQSSTLRFARRHGFAPRTLRNPLLSLWHLLCPLAALAAFPAGAPAAAAAFLAAWPLPSALLALRHGLSGASLAVWALTFLRWNVSGAALLGQVLRGEPFGAAGRSGSGG